MCTYKMLNINSESTTVLGIHSIDSADVNSIRMYLSYDSSIPIVSRGDYELSRA